MSILLSLGFEGGEETGWPIISSPPRHVLNCDGNAKRLWTI